MPDEINASLTEVTSFKKKKSQTYSPFKALIAYL